MDNIHLIEYIRHGMALKNLAENNRFDAIIYESLEKSKVELPENLTIHTLNTTHQTDINAQLMAYADTYDHILVILDTLHLYHISPFLEMVSVKKDADQTVTIVNLGTGASGISNKGTGELHDIGLSMEYGLSTYEPYDFVSFFSMLNQENNQLSYIRIPEAEYPGTLFPETPNHQSILDLTKHGLSGGQATLLCFGPQVLSCIQAHELLKEEKKAYDLFLSPQYGISPDNSALLASLEKTKKLIVLLDQSELSTYSAYIQSRLFEQGIHDLSTFQVITPTMQDITMSPSLSLYEQGGFSPEDIAKHILGN